MARNISQLGGDINRLKAEFQTAARGTLARIVMVEALNHFEQSWDNQGFTDSTVSKWKERKPPSREFNKNGSRSKSFTRWSQRNKGRAILVGESGSRNGTHLKDSLRGSISFPRVIISSDKPYAQVHNEGGKAGRGTGFTMPRRQFMGPSQKLDKNVGQKFDRTIDKLFKKYSI